MAQLKFPFFIPTIAILSQFFINQGVFSAKFRISNNCNQTIWPAISPTDPSPALSTSGFALQPGRFETVDAPSSWSGRIWGRTKCTTQNSTRNFTCLTGDCGSGVIGCSGASSVRATTFAEIKLDAFGGRDFYDVSLVNGFNLPVLVLPLGDDGFSNCSATGCEADINGGVCPPELAVKDTDDGEVVACSAACEVFKTADYCCNGDSNSCGPTNYSRLFKNACPTAYSYPTDDTTSLVSCPGGDYAFIFCPITRYEITRNKSLVNWQNSTRNFTCLTGDCGSGVIGCSGPSSVRATTFAEIALDSIGGTDFYDVSLVNGFNLPVLVLPQGDGSLSNCSATGCEADINGGACPPELAVKDTDDGEVVACNGGCEVFNTVQYCCDGASNSCGSTNYSRLFKNACPTAYSYPTDDTTSLFSCPGGDYAFIFCPSPNIFVRFNDSGTEVSTSPNCTSYNCSGTTNSSHCPSFNCGGLNVGYPFWQQDIISLSQYCGYPGFGLNCSRRGTPTLELLNNSNFFIQGINYSDKILTMGDIDVLNQSCPRARHNLTLSNLPLYPSSSSLNLSFYFNCSSPLSFASSIECLASNSNQSYVSLTGSEPENFSWLDYCEDNVVVTVLDSTVDVNNLNSTYRRVINQGFMLNWQPSLECRACEESSGSCGFDRQDQKFLCFCDDGNTSTGQCFVSVTPNQAWKIGIGIGVGLFAMLTSCVIFYLYIRKKGSSSTSGTFWKWKSGNDDKIEAFILKYGASAPKRYRYSEVKRMTNSFKDELGKGGYGKVFKGKLADDRLVAVKVLNASKGNGEEFINEVASIGRTSHVNIVTLLGFCYEGRKRALIYEFMPSGSLDKFIYGNDREEPSQHLGVEKLYEIALGIARGLEYLHSGCNTRILHLDIKPHNVLLDEDFCPKIADFGLAKLYPKKKSKVTSMEARGTIGYIAPEVFNRNLGRVSEKSDVYSYGMMVIEMLGGRNNNNNAEAVRSSEMYFPNWIYKRLEQDEDLQLQQQGPITMVDSEIARKMMLVGLWCIQTDPSQRPSMNKVIEMLEGSFEALEVPQRPIFPSPSRPTTNTTTVSI